MGTYSKLQQKKKSPYKMLRKINDIAFVVDLSDTLRIFTTFNVVDVYLFHSSGDPLYLDVLGNSSSSFSQVRRLM